MSPGTIEQLPILISQLLSIQDDFELKSFLQQVEPLLFNDQFALFIEAVPPEKRVAVWESYSDEAQRVAFVQFKRETRRWIIDILPDEKCFELLSQVDLEELLEIGEALPERFLTYAIKHLDETQKSLYQQAQQYTDTQLGHWLDYNYIRISEKLKIASAKRLLSKGISSYTDEFYTVNKQGLLTGTVNLNTLFNADESGVLGDLIDTDFLSLEAGQELSSASETLVLSGKMSLPVCDENKVFVGRFTIASAYQAKAIQAADKAVKAGGLNKDEDLFASVRQSSRNRSVWLGINLLTAFLASAVIGIFDSVLQQIVLLAVLMPVVASMGGISGSQTLTLIVRGLALGQITEANLRALLLKEIKVGLTNGIIWSCIIGGVTYVFFQDVGVSLVLSVAILVNLVAAAGAGVLIPALLNRFKIDPALSGAVLLTTITDVVGFMVFLGLGSLLLLG